MKTMRKAAALALTAALLCALLATAAFAAEAGSVWVDLDQENSATFLIVTDTTVTDGVLKLTYDSSALTYQSIEASEDYVAMYAVNAEEPGVIRISWVAPEAFDPAGQEVCLFQVHFSGSAVKEDLTFSGDVRNDKGERIPLIGAAEDETDSTEKPGASDGSDGNDSNDGNDNSADTGDRTQLALLGGLGLLSAAAAAILITMNKKGRWAK